MAHGQFEVWGLVRGQKGAKMGRSRCCLRTLLTDIGDWLVADDLEVHKITTDLVVGGCEMGRGMNKPKKKKV